MRRVRAGPSGLHGFAILRQPPRPADRERLATSGLTLLARLTRTVYLARAATAIDLRDTVIASRVRFLAVSEPRDRVAPEIWNGQFHTFVHRTPTGAPSNPVLNPDSTINVMVRFHADVEDAAAEQVIVQRSREPRSAGRAYWRAIVTQQQLRELAAVDNVRWIDAIPTGVGPDIDVTRDAVKVHQVQAFNTWWGQGAGVTGAGVRVGVFDQGIDAASRDFDRAPPSFGTRVVIDRPFAAHSHGTYIAGIIAGNGTRSSGQDSWGIANSGTLRQWRGIAPNAELIDAAKIASIDAVPPSVLRDQIATHQMVLSNHSHGLSVDGNYDALNQLHDNLIRGDDAGDGSPLPARLHVHSAGNYGKTPEVGNQRGFFSLNSQLKNALSVGNYYLAEARIASSSSMGPTHDGRIKPDVVAPGTFVTALGFCTALDNPLYYAEWGGSPLKPCDNRPGGASDPRRNFYFQQTGTSVAAAVATGVLTLVAEKIATTPNATLDPAAPLPSTLRAIAVHSAQDLTFAFDTQDGPNAYLQLEAFAGPDFATGFGMIDASAAIDVVEQRAVLEDVVGATCETRTYTMYVPAGILGPIKVTLAWDDPASDAPELASDVPLLINDLDVVLTDPAGTKHYPWLLDQQAVDADGAALGNDAQTCGTDVHVQRQLKATTSPSYLGEDASNVDDPIAAENIQPAGTGKDHLNNVEHVVAPVVAGEWTVVVTGFNIDQGPQRFSLIGVWPRPMIRFDPRALCRNFPVFCERRIWPACTRFPRLCRIPDFTIARNDALVFSFRDLADVKVIPISQLCYALGARLRCEASGRQPRPGLDLALSTAAQSLRIEVMDASGRILGRDTTSAASKRVRIPAGELPAFLMISSGAGARSGINYNVPVTVSPMR